MAGCLFLPKATLAITEGKAGAAIDALSFLGTKALPLAFILGAPVLIHFFLKAYRDTSQQRARETPRFTPLPPGDRPSAPSFSSGIVAAAPVYGAHSADSSGSSCSSGGGSCGGD